MTVGQKIKFLRKSKGLTQKELAEKLGLAPTAISAWERDANRPMMDSLAIMSELFEVSIEYFYSKEEKVSDKPSNIIEVSPATVKVPIIGEIACGDPILADENIIGYRYESPDRLPSGTTFYLEAAGDSMEPTIPNGSHVLIREQPEVEYGEIAAVLVNGNTEATLKKVTRQGNTILLVPINREYEPIVVSEDNPVRILGKAIRVTRDL